MYWIANSVPMFKTSSPRRKQIILKQFWAELIKPIFLLHRLSVSKPCAVNVIFS
jgi:hypothetical protein